MHYEQVTAPLRRGAAQGATGGIPHRCCAVMSFTELSASPLELLRARGAPPPCHTARGDKGHREASRQISVGIARMIDGKRQQPF